MDAMNESMNVSLFLRRLNKCRSFSQLEYLHTSVCRQLSVERRKVFLRLIDEHYGQLSEQQGYGVAGAGTYVVLPLVSTGRVRGG
jgi:hypothetical protein